MGQEACLSAFCSKSPFFAFSKRIAQSDLLREDDFHESGTGKSD